MRKKALLAALMAMILLTSGCALIVKDEAVDAATPVIRMGDQVITKAEVKAQVESELYQQASWYQMFGQSFDYTDPANIAAAQESAIEALKKDMVLNAKAKELGFDQLTAEDEASIKENAQKDLDSIISQAKNYVENAEGMSEEELTEAATKQAEESGYTLDAYVNYEKGNLISKRLKDYAIQDVAVTDEEIQAEYESKVAANKETYAEKPGSWATAANNGTTLYYTPAGVRRVKQILTKFKDEDQAAIDEANKQLTEANTALSTAQAKVDSAQSAVDTEGITDEDKAAAEETLNAAKQELDEADKALLAANEAVTAATDKAFANLDEEVDAILASLDAEGADWQAIMDEKNQDPGMKSNEKGYAVAADMTGFDSAFVEAAMALEKPGDHSGKVKGTSYGYYIIRYEGDEAEGPVDLETVKETISSSLLSTKQEDTYDAAVAEWVEAAGIKVDLNALKD
ncbi:MAG: hypothetical protein IKS46_04145 [Clostridia bacterium]|nr:hypothetical protein [Clostridia bacterium]